MRSRIGPRFRLRTSFFIYFLPAVVVATTTVAEDGVPERCIKCHAETVIVEKVAKMPAQERADKLEAFLPGHFAPDPVERAAIIAALKAKIEKPK